MGVVHRCSTAFAVILSLWAAAYASKDECVYTMSVKTGSVIKGGTDSKISALIGDGSGGEARIPDLEKWGLMGPGYDYYEIGNRDIFTGHGPCLSGPICRLNLTSDGSGSHHGWFCDYLEVTATGPHKPCTKTIFYIRQWLSTDAPPYKLSALLDGCAQTTTPSAASTVHGSEPLVVENENLLPASKADE